MTLTSDGGSVLVYFGSMIGIGVFLSVLTVVVTFLSRVLKKFVQK